MLFLYVIFLNGILVSSDIYYDTFTGNPITLEEYKKHVQENTTFWCTGKYKPCDPEEGRRLDGSCNNLRFPTKGPSHTPYLSLLPLVFGKNNEPVRTKCGKELDYRKLRTATLAEGTIPDQKFSALFVHYLLFAFSNIASLHDTVNYIRWRQYCCEPKGKKDPQCYPMKISSDDTVHQFSGIRCFNNTRPVSYQSEGCIRDKASTPQRLNSANSYLDLSNVYGPDDSSRLMKDGMIKYEVENGKIWPPSVPSDGVCLLNQPPRETRCHKRTGLNSLFGLNFFAIIFLRHHNFIAQRLKAINPRWNDEKLFTTAREINIATYVQIYYNELMPPFLGKNYMMKNGLIARNGEFRDPYIENLPPQQYLEYSYVLRWAHTIQPGQLEMYDDNGNYLNKIAAVNMTFRTGYLPVDRNMEGLTQGTFRQGAGRFDHIVDPTLSQTGIPVVQRAFDILAADLMKGGLFGLQSYTAYRQLCSGRRYMNFDDLYDDMDPENIEILKSNFKDVTDVPLMVGIWLEKSIPGGFAPRTFACVVTKQLRRFMQTDRHWYQRPNRPNAFTKEQLNEIRKATVARVLCDVGDSVKSITPHSFLRVGPWNRVTDCAAIPRIDYRAWKNPSY